MVTTITGASISTANLNLDGTAMSDELANINGSLANLTGVYKIGKVVAEYDSANWSHNSATTWKEWPTAGFTNHTGFTGGNLLHIEYWIPMRNDSSSWGGGYIDTNITFNNGVSWRSLGTPGYDGGVMVASSGNAIHGQNQTYLITNTPSTDYSVQLRFMIKTYDSTVYVNQSHDINRTGTAGFCPAGTDGIADTRLGGTDSNQTYGSYRIIEYIPT